jgi:PAS domain S-box-containing protein
LQNANFKTLHSILNNLTEGVIVADKNGRFLYFNRVAEDILGIGLLDSSVDQWSSLYGCYYPDKKTQFPSHELPLARALEGNTILNQVLYIKNSKKSRGVFISVSAEPVRDETSMISGGIVIFQDITRQVKAENENKQNRERERVQFKRMPIPTFVWKCIKDDFVFTDYNRAAALMTRRKVRHYLNRRASEMFKDFPQIMLDLKRCFDEKNSLNVERFFKVQEYDFYRDFNLSYIFLAPDTLIIHAEDITDQKKSKKELSILSKAVEQTADSIVISDKKGIMTFVNPAFEQITGYSRDEVIGKTFKILKSGEQPPDDYKKLWSTILSGKPFRGEFINRKKSGDLYWCQQSITPLKDQMGKITHFVSVIKDMTQEKEKQEQEFQFRIAREVQQRFYNITPQISGLDIAAVARPAVDVGGDYFDVVTLDDDDIALIVGDVSGHGIGSALIMAEVRAYLRAFTRFEYDPGRILTLLNNELCADLDKLHFVTLVLVRINVKKRVLDYASAGHEPGYIFRNDGHFCSELTSNGVPLGFIDDYQFKTSQTTLVQPNTTLVLLTDGIVETLGDNQQQFGESRALEVIRQSLHLPSLQMIEKLFDSVQQFSRTSLQEDDLTSLVCKFS